MESAPSAPSAPSATRPAVPARMQAVVADRYGTAEVLRITEVPTPVPGAGEVLVRVEASSINPLDWHFVTGTPYFIRAVGGLRRPKHPVPGADVAGTVVDVGAGVVDPTPGDVVFGECGHGSFAEYVTVPAEQIVTRPPSVAVEAAAALPVAGLTAVQALRTHGSVQPGDRVLVNGAAGGVGTFAVQIAAALDAEVTAVCSTRNVEMVRSLGAAVVVDYCRDDFVAGGRRFDLMIDNVGNRSAQECLDVLRPHGRYVAVSGPKENRLLGPVPKVVRTWLAFRRASQSFHQFVASPNRADLTFLADLVAGGQVTPAIDRVVGLDGVAAGLAEIGGGHAPAKIVVVPA